MADQPTEKKRIVRTGYNDRLYKMGLSQGNLAGYVNDPYNFSSTPIVAGNTVISRRDDILITEGGGGARAVEQYTRLFNDGQVLSAFDKFADEIIQREWVVSPVSDSDKDEEIAEFVRQTIYRIGCGGRQSRGRDMLVAHSSGFDSFVKGMCESLILGISIAEISWARQGSYVVPSQLLIRDPRRFLFVLNEDGSVSPRLVTINSPVEGLPIPMRSMIIHRHHAYKNLADVYGTGLGRVIYSLVEFRRTLMSFWLQYADKHTTPTAVGKFSLGTPEEEVQSLFTSLQRLGQETSIVLPDEMSVEFLKSEGRPELYENLITYIDKQISYLINGESVVGQEGSGVGSFARDQVADSVRIRKAKAFSNELDQVINSTLIRWIVELNYPNASIPRIYRDFSDIEQRGEDPVKTVQILTQLQAVGYQVTDLDWLRDKLLIPSLEKMDMSQMPGMPGMGETQSVESGESNTPVLGERAIGQMLSNQKPISSENLDFTEFDEDGDLKDQTTRDKVAKKIAERFSQGGLDEVGWDRVAVGISGNDAETSRVVIDEYTSPGDIIYTAKRLLDEVRSISLTTPPEHDRFRRDLVEYENIVLRGDELPAEQVGGLINTYALTYRLNRRFVHNECVVLDPEATGYWSYFAPYYM